MKLEVFHADDEELKHRVQRYVVLTKRAAYRDVPDPRRQVRTSEGRLSLVQNIVEVYGNCCRTLSTSPCRA